MLVLIIAIIVASGLVAYAVSKKGTTMSIVAEEPKIKKELVLKDRPSEKTKSGKKEQKTNAEVKPKMNAKAGSQKSKSTAKQPKTK